MNTRHVIGRRIVEVRQRRCKSEDGDTVMDLMAIILDDGTELIPNHYETKDRYGAMDMIVVAPQPTQTERKL